MSVYYLPTAVGRDDLPADETARELVFLAGHDTLLLPDDDAFDLAAVELAANGVRQVRLTLAERLTAATRILATGGSVRSVCLRLGLPPDTERKWAQLNKRFVSVVSAIILVAAVAATALTSIHTEPARHHIHHAVRDARIYRDDHKRT